MSVSRNDIAHIAHLARLNVSDAEAGAYADKLGRIIDFIAALDAADTGDLLPMAHPLEMTQRLRADEVTAGDERDRYQQNARETRDGLYIVPRVVE